MATRQINITRRPAAAGRTTLRKVAAEGAKPAFPVYDERGKLIGVVLDPDRIQRVDPGELNQEDVQKVALAKFADIRRRPQH